MARTVATIMRETLAEFPSLSSLEGRMGEAFSLLRTCFASGNKLLVCGNGGSAADAEHIVGELMNKFAFERPMPLERAQRLRAVAGERAEKLISSLQPALPAISLVSQASLLTAVANDIAADLVFAQQVFGYGRPGDVLLGLSTSGNSANVVQAALVARALEMKVIGMTGEKQNRLQDLCDVCICVPSSTTYKIQQYHQVIYHALCAMVEQEFFGEK